MAVSAPVVTPLGGMVWLVRKPARPDVMEDGGPTTVVGMKPMPSTESGKVIKYLNTPILLHSSI